MHSKTKPWFMAFTDFFTGIVMKIGIIVILVSILYLMFVFFGETVRNYSNLSEFDQTYFVNSIVLVTKAFTISTVVVVLALMMSYFYDEPLSQWLSFSGAVFYFGVPVLLIMLTGEAEVKQYPLLDMIVTQMRDVGLIVSYSRCCSFSQRYVYAG